MSAHHKHVDLFQNVFWYKWIKNWPLDRLWFLLCVTLLFYLGQVALILISDTERLIDVVGLRFVFSVIFVLSIAGSVLIVRFLEADVQAVLAFLPEGLKGPTPLTSREAAAVYSIGMMFGACIGMMIEGTSYFYKIIYDLSILIPSLGLALILGPGAAFQLFGSWRICRWLAAMTNATDVDLLRPDHLEVFVKPMFTLIVFALVMFSIGPLFFLLEQRWADFGFLTLGLSFFLILVFTPIFILPVLAVRRRITEAKQEELNRIDRYLSGETDVLRELRPATLAGNLSFSDVLNWKHEVENLMTLPIRLSLKRNLLLFLLPICSWGTAILIELLL